MRCIDANHRGFLDEFVAPVVADPERFASEFAAWLLGRTPEPEEQQLNAKLTSSRRYSRRVLARTLSCPDPA